MSIGLVNAYRLLVRPLLAGGCRFTPSCSAYALDAIAHHGASQGMRLALMRIARCHPWHDGGYDPVPTTEKHG